MHNIALHKFVNHTDYVSLLFRAATIGAVVQRAHSHKSLTPMGIAAAVATGVIHSLPKTNLYLVLLIVFFLTSSKATKYKLEEKERIVKTLKGDPSAESSAQRTEVQVFANSGVASALIIASFFTNDYELSTMCHAGVVVQYAAVIADTWSSEIGILSKTSPFLLTNFQKVPPGTNGGVTTLGLMAGTTGSALIAAIAAAFDRKNIMGEFIFFTVMGCIGNITDSLIGQFLQASYADAKDGKVLEPMGGDMVPTEVLWEKRDSLKKVTGENVLSNNQVNMIMALQTTMLGMGLYVYLFS